MRTLIVAQGLERRRILAAISIHAPNKVIVLRNTNDVTSRVREDVQVHMGLLKGELSPKRGFKPYPFVFKVDIENYKTDFFDIVRAFSDINKLIDEEKRKKNEVVIDLSTGNKTITMALFLAAQTNKLKSTYCKAGKYFSKTQAKGKQTKPAEIAHSAKEPVEVPQFPLYLEDLPYNLLAKLVDLKKVSSISELLKEMGQKPVKSNILSLSRKLDILAEHNYIKLSRLGKRKEIEITELGKQISLLKQA